MNFLITKTYDLSRFCSIITSSSVVYRRFVVCVLIFNSHDGQVSS